MSNTDQKKQNSWKRSFIEWGIMGIIAAIIYAMGWHTEVIGTMQRALLWTGLFDADTSKIETTNGPQLTSRDFNFALQTAAGEQQLFSEYKGKVIFLNVWASWCPPCVAEMPTIETLYDRVGQSPHIEFVMLSLDEKQQKAVDFMENKEFPMPYYFPASGLPNTFRSQYLPTTYVISPEGQIVYKKEGIADYSSLTFAQWMKELTAK
jgi:thiol-disulfide isomerase/thioredoxin